MARDHLPSAKERRRLLEQKASGLAQAGAALLREGRWGEALECLTAVGDAAGLDTLAGQALEAGDLFTWRRALEALGREPDPQGLAQIKTRAQELGKPAFAQAAQDLLEPAGEPKP